MIDLHSHTILSDGELTAGELARRAEVTGYKVLAITDHADMASLETIISQTVKAAAALNKSLKTKIIPGVELTYVPLGLIIDTVKKARSLGAKLVLVHGETIVEPSIPGTNQKALEADIDILAHPGLITREEVELAKKRGIYLEISGRKGHSLTNGHVAKLAQEIGAKLTFGTDTHAPENLVTREGAEKIIQGAGLNKKEAGAVFANARSLVETISP